MKKTVILAVIGMAAGVASSFGQGYVSLDSYNSGTLGAFVSYGAGVPLNGVSGAVGSGGLTGAWTAGLYWVAGTQSLSDPAGTGTPIAPLVLGTGNGSSVAFATSDTGGTLGRFSSVPSFNSGSTANTTLTLEIVAYPTSAGSYANAAYRGHSAPFSVATVAATSPTPSYTDGFTSFSVAAVPEPTTLALAGLGGFGMLMALRRKQA